MREAAERVRDPCKTGVASLGSGLSVARDTQHDQSRVDRVQVFPAESPLLQRTGAKVLNQDVNTFLPQKIFSLGTRRSSTILEQWTSTSCT